MLFDFDDILIQPTNISPISSRSQINVKYDNGMLPLMTAPMDTVINHKNQAIFQNLGIGTVMPRIANPDKTYIESQYFLSYSLQDFEKIFLYNNAYIPNQHKVYALIDIANGHQENLYEIAKKAKIKYGDNLFLMVGNVANPSTFLEYTKIKVDMVRIGIGNGNACLTTVQTGVGYPMASLINECKSIKNHSTFETQIIADGGFKNYSDIIKALAIGADYVMLGSIFNKALESAGLTTKFDVELSEEIVIDQFSEDARNQFKCDIPLFKSFRGMSTKEVQKEWGKTNLTTSEGIIKNHQVEYTLESWTNNFVDYLKSAMSYCGKFDLKEFIGNVEYNLITQNAYKRFNK